MKLSKFVKYTGAGIFFLLFSISVSAEDAKKTIEKKGLVTGVAYSVAEKKITLTVSLGTMKIPEPEKNENPVSSEDMITLSGETVTVTLNADDAVSVGNMPPPPDSNGEMPPPPPCYSRDAPDMKPSVNAKDVLVDDIVTLECDSSTSAVTDIEVDKTPCRAPGNPGDGFAGGRMPPPPRGNGPCAGGSPGFSGSTFGGSSGGGHGSSGGGHGGGRR